MPLPRTQATQPSGKTAAQRNAINRNDRPMSSPFVTTAVIPDLYCTAEAKASRKPEVFMLALRGGPSTTGWRGRQDGTDQVPWGKGGPDGTFTCLLRLLLQRTLLFLWRIR